MSSIDDYLKNGGSLGYATKILEAEIIAAMADKNHILSPLLQKIKIGDIASAQGLLKNILFDASRNRQSPLHIPAIAFAGIPAFKAAIEFVKDNMNNRGQIAEQNFPIEVIMYASADYFSSAKASQSARKKTNSYKEKVIDMWKAQTKKMSYSAFSRYAFYKLGGARDEDGKNITKIPEERTIALYVSQYEKQKKLTVS